MNWPHWLTFVFLLYIVFRQPAILQLPVSFELLIAFSYIDHQHLQPSFNWSLYSFISCRKYGFCELAHFSKDQHCVRQTLSFRIWATQLKFYGPVMNNTGVPCFIAFCFIVLQQVLHFLFSVFFFFYKLKARPSTSKILQCAWFIAILALLWLSGTEPAVSLRSACRPHILFYDGHLL